MSNQPATNSFSLKGLLIAVTMCATIGGCYANFPHFVTQQDEIQLKRGMTMREVEKILGKPSTRNHAGPNNGEQWGYWHEISIFATFWLEFDENGRLKVIWT